MSDYGPTVSKEDRYNPHAEIAYLKSALSEAREQIERLTAELKPFQPMTMAEAEAAMAELDVDPTPLSEEEIDGYVKFATDPEYRADHLQGRLKTYMHVNRTLRDELASRDAQLATLREALEEGRRYHQFCKERMGPVTQPNACWHAEHDCQLETIAAALSPAPQATAPSQGDQ